MKDNADWNFSYYNETWHSHKNTPGDMRTEGPMAVSAGMVRDGVMDVEETETR